MGDVDGSTAPDVGRATFGRYPDGEVWAHVETPVDGRDCALVGSLAPPDGQTISTLVLAHALHRAGAGRIVAVLPYLGYGRQDKADRASSLGVAWAGSLLAACGVDEVVTVDIHSRPAADLLGLPVTSLSPARLFAAELRDPRDLSIVAPDEGAVGRATAVAQAAGVPSPVAHLRKHRSAEGIAHSTLVGEVRPRVVLVDDILDTGATLLSACGVLRDAGVVEISIMATHGTFSGHRWRDLPTAGVGRIVVTDSVPDAAARSQRLAEVISVAPLLADALRRA